MTAVTVQGSIGQKSIFFPTSTPIQTALAEQILVAAFSSLSTELVTGPGGAITSALVVDIAGQGSILTGAASISSAQIALGGLNGVYETGATAVSEVVAADFTGSSVVNNNPNGALLAATGAGANVLLGLAGANNLFTGIAGQDVVILNGASNALTTNGSDAVLVGGPSTVTAAATGVDNVLVTSGTTLNFIDGSGPGLVDSITGAANATIVLAGYGGASITAGSGPESFYIDTSSGNVTLNGNLQPVDTFEFVKNMDNSTANILINNFAPGETVNLHGYASFNVIQTPGPGAGVVLELSDGGKVTFSNMTTTAIQQAIKTV